MKTVRTLTSAPARPRAHMYRTNSQRRINMMIRVIETGRPYIPTITRWPETAHFDCDPEEGLCQLTIFMPSPSIQDIGTIRRHPVRFGVGVLNGVVYVTYDWPGLKGDAPYSWHVALRACLSPGTV